MKSIDIRRKFFEFFQEHKHTKVPSSSLIPAADPTLLFANAGMNQFKDVFLGNEKRSYTRAVSIQKCVRAGGKHNDLENVGFTARHCTFFEMMGNFSFGDYFKKDAIHFAWDFLTKNVGLPAEKLIVTVFREDNEAYDIWHKEIGIPENRIFRLGEKDNFWAMGDIGPCGPCTEILYDRGTTYGADCDDPSECGDRYMEIWNLVFMQYNRQPDSSLAPLRQKGVDTGMGLERISMVLQGVDSVHETDLFTSLIERIEQLTGIEYAKQTTEIKAAFRVLADHVRSSSLIIADGCTPSNEGRGYVLRKIIRRAALFEKKLSNSSIFPQLADTFIHSMSDIYPELKTNRTLILALLKDEIDRFAHNLMRGQEILKQYFAVQKTSKQLTGQQVFKLYDTYGFPLEATEAAAREQGYLIDRNSFEQYMEQQRLQSGKKDDTHALLIDLDPELKTQFVGYDELENTANVQAIVVDNKLVDSAKTEAECWIIPTSTPFYAERGGQQSDQGLIEIAGFTIPALEIKQVANAVAIRIHAPCTLKVGTKFVQRVDSIRADTMRNHTATHLLQAALLEVLGNQIKQSGSLVGPTYLRFDFNYHQTLDLGTLKELEEIVNQSIWVDAPVTITTTTLAQAKARGVIAHFDEKYNPENVRLVEIKNISAELCGGTHVRSTGQIGCFKIIQDAAIAAGTRRIIAITGSKALERFQDDFLTVHELSQHFKVQHDQVYKSVLMLAEQAQAGTSEIKKLKRELLFAHVPAWLEQIELVGTTPFLFVVISQASIEELRDVATLLAQKREGLFMLISQSGDKGIFVATISPSLKGKVDLPLLSRWLKDTYQLSGGGNQIMIQGGGPVVVVEIKDALKERLRS